MVKLFGNKFQNFFKIWGVFSILELRAFFKIFKSKALNT